jgi:hypothetical protein
MIGGPRLSSRCSLGAYGEPPTQLTRMIRPHNSELHLRQINLIAQIRRRAQAVQDEASGSVIVRVARGKSNAGQRQGFLEADSTRGYVESEISTVGGCASE